MNPEIKLISEACLNMLQPKAKLSFTEEQLDTMTQEEFDAIDEEQLDELSKTTLQSYLDKATHRNAFNTTNLNFPRDMRDPAKGIGHTGPDAKEKDTADLKKSIKHGEGVHRALLKAYPEEEKMLKKKFVKHDKINAREKEYAERMIAKK